MSSDFRLTVTNTQVSSGDYKVTLKIERVSGTDGEEILVYAGLAEEEVM